MDRTALVPVGSSSGVATSRRGKAKALDCVVSVRRSSRANKYDGFKVPPLTDSKMRSSKVKPRVIPNVASSVSNSEVSLAQRADGVPPPMPIPMIQQVGVQKCAIPPEELTAEALLADSEEGPSSS